MSASPPAQFWLCRGAFLFFWVAFYVAPHSLGFDYEICIPLPYFIGLTLKSHSVIGKCNI